MKRIYDFKVAYMYTYITSTCTYYSFIYHLNLSLSHSLPLLIVVSLSLTFHSCSLWYAQSYSRTNYLLEDHTLSTGNVIHD